MSRLGPVLALSLWFACGCACCSHRCPLCDSGSCPVGEEVQATTALKSTEETTSEYLPPPPAGITQEKRGLFR